LDWDEFKKAAETEAALQLLPFPAVLQAALSSRHLPIHTTRAPSSRVLLLTPPALRIEIVSIAEQLYPRANRAATLPRNPARSEPSR
jgi:hypothetical protein